MNTVTIGVASIGETRARMRRAFGGENKARSSALPASNSCGKS